MICPKCLKPVDGISEHQYFDLDLMSIRCTPCLMFSIVGASEWVQFPRFAGDKGALFGFRPPNGEAERLAIAEHEKAHHEATQKLRALAEEVSAANSAIRLQCDRDFRMPELTPENRQALQKSLEELQSKGATSLVQIEGGMTFADPACDHQRIISLSDPNKQWCKLCGLTLEPSPRYPWTETLGTDTQRFEITHHAPTASGCCVSDKDVISQEAKPLMSPVLAAIINNMPMVAKAVESLKADKSKLHDWQPMDAPGFTAAVTCTQCGLCQGVHMPGCSVESAKAILEGMGSGPCERREPVTALGCPADAIPLKTANDYTPHGLVELLEKGGSPYAKLEELKPVEPKRIKFREFT